MKVDPQYMDMNFSQYYFVPWPEAQRFLEADENDEYCVEVDDGCFVDMEWFADVNQIEL